MNTTRTLTPLALASLLHDDVGLRFADIEDTAAELLATLSSRTGFHADGHVGRVIETLDRLVLALEEAQDELTDVLRLQS